MNKDIINPSKKTITYAATLSHQWSPCFQWRSLMYLI